MRRSIGGLLTLDALKLLYGSAPVEHRPNDAASLRAAAVELAGRGLLEGPAEQLSLGYPPDHQKG